MKWMDRAKGGAWRAAMWLMFFGVACGQESGPGSQVAPPAAAPAAETSISIGTEVSLSSSILGEQRTIQIALPASYATNHEHTRYPVVYLLDGQMFFHMATGVVRQLSSDASPHAPEMIVVGIPSQQRVRDSSPTRSMIGPLGKEEQVYEVSGGADKFLRFLTDELAPYIDRTYSTSGYRILIGYSFTGLFTMHAVFTRPESFNAYIGIDPSWWWDDYVLEKEAQRFIASASVEKRDLFVTTTTNNPPLEFLPIQRYVDTLAKMLEATPVKGLRFGIEIYDDETHHSVALRSIYDGLSHIFDGYAPSLDTLYAHPERLEEQYQSLSRRLGVETFLSEGLINYFGYVFLNTYPDQDKSLLYFRLNTAHYPRSANVWDSLAEAYAVQGRRDLAIENYRKSLELNPANANAAAQLKKLEAAPPGSNQKQRREVR
jgi:predicted alpha/beta superfamily hydrolase